MLTPNVCAQPDSGGTKALLVFLLREVALRVLTAIASAFCMMTLCWIGRALATPGDFFANGSSWSSWMLPSEIGARIVGPARLVGNRSLLLYSSGVQHARDFVKQRVDISLASYCIGAPPGDNFEPLECDTHAG
jgi:hypothetical protein